MNSHAKFRGAARRGFSVIYGKPPGGADIRPPPVGARVNDSIAMLQRDIDSSLTYKQTNKNKRLTEESMRFFLIEITFNERKQKQLFAFIGLFVLFCKFRIEDLSFLKLFRGVCIIETFGDRLFGEYALLTPARLQHCNVFRY